MNSQAIRLVNQEITGLQTKLRHVDIDNHSRLRQEVLLKRINVIHTKSKDTTSSMIPDGLTKVLPKEDFMRFRDQMGLVEIAERIKEQEKVNH